jgi:hypothetical protein
MARQPSRRTDTLDGGDGDDYLNEEIRSRLFIIDDAKALLKPIRQTFGRHTPIQRSQIRKARNIVVRRLGRLHGERPQGAPSSLGDRRCGAGRATGEELGAPPGGARRRVCPSGFKMR